MLCYVSLTIINHLCLSSVCAQIGQFVQETLTPQFGDVTSAANRLRNAVSQETKQFGSVSLAALDRRTIQG